LSRISNLAPGEATLVGLDFFNDSNGGSYVLLMGLFLAIGLGLVDAQQHIIGLKKSLNEKPPSPPSNSSCEPPSKIMWLVLRPDDDLILNKV